MNDMEKVLLEEASSADVRAFARLFLQIEGADDMEIKKLRGAVEKTWPQNFIWKAKPVEVIQRTAPADNIHALTKDDIEKKAGTGIAPTSSKGDPIVELVIAKTDAPGGKDPIFLNVNGMANHIARGIPQKVPYRYYLDLMNTVQRLHNWDERTGEYSSEEVTRFQPSIHRMPSDDEIFAWERQDLERCGQVFTREMFDARRAKEVENRARAEQKSEDDRRLQAGGYRRG